MLISDKVDFGANKITTDREKRNIMIKGSIHQSYIGRHKIIALQKIQSKN